MGQEHRTHDDKPEQKWQARIESRIHKVEHQLSEQLLKAKLEEEEKLAKKAAKERKNTYTIIVRPDRDLNLSSDTSSSPERALSGKIPRFHSS